MFAIALALVLALCTAAPSAAPPSRWDERVAKAHHEAFLLGMLTAHWGEEKTRERFPDMAKKALPATTQVAFAIDPTRGVYTNTPTHRGKLAWRAVGLVAWPDDDASKLLGALAELDYHYEYGFNGDTAPALCVPARSASHGYLGAAACYFTIEAEYFEPGFWVALREVDGRVVVAGVLEHEVALEDPSKDRGLAAFLAAVDQKFAPSDKPADKKVP